MAAIDDDDGLPRNITKVNYFSFKDYSNYVQKFKSMPDTSSEVILATKLIKGKRRTVFLKDIMT